MGHVEHGDGQIVADALEVGQDARAQGGVEGGEGLVEEQEGRGRGQRAGEGDALALAARQAGDAAVEQGVELEQRDDVLELAARARAILRRVELMKQSPADADHSKYAIDAGPVHIDPSRREVTLRGNSVDLTAREFDLLEYLARHPGRVFRRADLLDSVWGYGHEGYEHTVNSHINRLRAKIDCNPSEPEMIVTVWGVGYKFSAQAPRICQ